MNPTGVRKTTLALLAILILGPAGPASEPGSVNLPEMRRVLDRWIEVRQLISREESQAAEQLTLLEGRVALLRDQVKAVEERVADTRGQIEDVDRRWKELVATDEQLDEALASSRSRLRTLEIGIRGLLAAMPQVLRDRVQALSQQIPNDPETTRLGLATRYQNLIGVLTAMGNFNSEVTVTTEVRDLGGAEAMEVKVVYFGLGQAYFCNRDATVGGVGVPSAEGWIWERRDEIAEAVSITIARYMNDIPAAYEALPVTLVDRNRE
jgi:hypothetical protein